MKREIRFRAWDKVEKKLCPVQVISEEGCFLLGLKPGNDQIIPDLRMIVKAPQDGKFCYYQDIELMQYTGLKDKNGVEIYEGDILSIDNEENLVIAKCLWKSGQFTLEDNCYGHWTRQLYYQPERLLVIGNIYENPELL